MLIRFVSVVVLTALCRTTYAGEPTFSFTHEITGNDIFGLSGHEDTLWMVTNWGINYTIAKSEILSWSGFKAEQGRFSGAISFGDGTVLAGLSPGLSTINPNVISSNLWMLSYKNPENYTVIIPGFENDPHLDSIVNSTNFSVVDIAWSKNAFWIACMDGGLLRLASDNTSKNAFFPGVKDHFAPSSITGAIKSPFPDFPDTSQRSDKRVIAVEVSGASTDTPVMWVATPAKLWKFTPDTIWDTLPSSFIDPQLTFRYYQNIYVSGASDSPSVYAAIKIKKGDSKADTIGFFKFDTSTHSWKTLMGNCESVPLVAFGQGTDCYVVVGNQIRMYRNGVDALSPVWNGDIFQKRMTSATGGMYPNYINDILCLQRSGGALALWIATSTNSLPTDNGLFFSLDEKKDEQDTAAFHYVHRDKKLTAGMKQSYAYPGILNSSNGAKAIFAYNLSKPSKVTIRIFDWNMDPVKTVVRDKERPAGNERTNGRSTVAAEDVWDGTNDAGRRVASGVYYYKITATSGERSFGKIIVVQ